jgi:hypothetical protein
MRSSARQVRQALRRTRLHRYLQARGYSLWRPLVPKAEFYETQRRNIQALRQVEPEGELGDYVEFGVSRGTSMAMTYRALNDAGMAGTRLIGFDSFEGMPEEAATQGWEPGEFHSTLPATRRYLVAQGVDLSRITLVKGWFKDTLTPRTRSEYKMTKASIVMIDCDIYSASKEALAFSEPLIASHAVLIFDDWGPMEDAGMIGQKEALEEFLREHPDLKVEPLSGYSQNSRVFLVSRSRSS